MVRNEVALSRPRPTRARQLPIRTIDIVFAVYYYVRWLILMDLHLLNPPKHRLNETTPKQIRGPFKCYVTLFFGKLDTDPPPRNANNVEPLYTFVTFFSGKFDTPPPPRSALRHTLMTPYLPSRCLCRRVSGLISRKPHPGYGCRLGPS